MGATHDFDVCTDERCKCEMNLGQVENRRGKGQEEKEVDIGWRSESSLQKDHLEVIVNVEMSHLMRFIFDSNVIMKVMGRFSKTIR